MTNDPLDDFTAREVTVSDVTRRVYSQGTGPAVIVIAEMPGITPKVADFARKVAARGLTAVMPSLFGVDGQDPRPSNLGRIGTARTMVGTIAKACISREFTVFATGKTSPIADWLRGLAAQEHERCGGRGVGAVGMCFTGGFALAMATDDRLLAPVMSQPSLPLGVTSTRRRSVGLDDDDLARVTARCAAGMQVMGLRFDGDLGAPRERFEFLHEQLGDAFLSVELPDSSANPDSMLPKPHSVLTEDLVDEPGQPTYEAREQVLDFLVGKLQATV